MRGCGFVKRVYGGSPGNQRNGAESAKMLRKRVTAGGGVNALVGVRSILPPSFPYPPPSFPRRRESIPGLAFDKTELPYYHRPMATTRKYKTTAQGDAPHMLRPAIPNPQSTIYNLRSTMPPTRNRQNPTETRACARTF